MLKITHDELKRALKKRTRMRESTKANGRPRKVWLTNLRCFFNTRCMNIVIEKKE
jgi:hypothetical protein